MRLEVCTYQGLVAVGLGLDVHTLTDHVTVTYHRATNPPQFIPARARVHTYTRTHLRVCQ